MGEPKVTTIIPTYERPVLMKRAVLSVLGQSYSDFIVQILDNASTDNTASVARELIKVDSRVQYYRHKKNIGSLNNMIYGMQNVTTRYFNILCDDDVLLPEFMRDALLVHEQSNSRLAFVSTRVVAVNEGGQFVDKMIHPKEVCILTPPEGIERCLKAGVSLTGVVYRTCEISKIGSFRESWWNWTETGWHALAAVTSPIGFSPTIGGIFMDHVEGGSKQMGRVEFRLSWFKMFAEVYDKAQDCHVSPAWWAKHLRPLAYRKFLGSAVRLCSQDGVGTYDELGRLGGKVGVHKATVTVILVVARMARVLWIGRLVNVILDGCQWIRWNALGALFQSRRKIDNDRLEAVSRVFCDLNEEVGLN